MFFLNLAAGMHTEGLWRGQKVHCLCLIVCWKLQTDGDRIAVAQRRTFRNSSNLACNLFDRPTNISTRYSVLPLHVVAGQDDEICVYMSPFVQLSATRAAGD